MMNVLDEIVAHKRNEIEQSKATIPLDALKSTIADGRHEQRPFRALFEAGPVLIAEIKPKSPSAGELIAQSPLDVADIYAKSEVDVISVLTDAKYFGGDLELLKNVRARVPQTILRKDFIVDEYQVYETAAAGADAFLLIAAALDAGALGSLAALGKELGLGTLVEVHDEEELERALSCSADITGINNRNLKTLAVDLGVTELLAKKIPAGTPFISESGIFSAADVERVSKAGARGILVGTSILQSSDPLAKIAELKQALT
jgi:indole-3-glycerol phosphate synthase